ncbi:MAG: outer membrane protein assembly factor [Herminiimonas sp.]|nr:outer membrane protein assembly factor [Herminiimonas sp.]
MAQVVRNYRVEIIGAGLFTDLLNTHLEIRRHESDAGMRDDEIERLVAIAPQQVRELLATEGYFNPTVESALVQTDNGRVARLTVTTGAPVTIGSIDIHYTGAIAGEDQSETGIMDRLRRQWTLQEGERFRQSDWNDAKGDLLKSLLTRRYPAARIVDSEARIDPEKRTAALTVNIDSGPVFTFGQLQIEGLSRYSRTMIDTLNPIVPGEPFSQEKLNELQARVQDTGYFKSAFATIEVDPAQAGSVPVRLDLTENERKRLSAGVGFSTDTGAQVQFKWLDRNFLGKQWRFESELRLDQKAPLASAAFYLPALKNGWRPTYDARFERTDIASEINDKIRVGARVTSPDKNNEQVWGTSLLADRQRIGEDFSNNRRALIATYGYTRRRVDNLLSPQSGYVASADLALGVAGIDTRASLARMVVHGTWLVPFDRTWLGVFRSQAGQVFTSSRDNIPGDLLFRTGGDQTVRGYAFNSLGVAQQGAIVGGRVYALASAEIVYRITPVWGAAAFVDAGNAADAWKDFKFQAGTGVGARWRSPIGPVNVDLAYGIETRKPRLHFSVGYGF